jgi:hypothetical protein
MRFVHFRLLILLWISILIFVSCAPELTKQHAERKNYEINQAAQVSIGAPIISNQSVFTVKEKRWVGYAFSPDGWKVTEYTTSDSTKQELIYTGRSGNTINVSYREYLQDFVRPAFFQELRYDLSQSDIIVFRNYRIQVLEANNEFMRYKVLAD